MLWSPSSPGGAKGEGRGTGAHVPGRTQSQEAPVAGSTKACGPLIGRAVKQQGGEHILLLSTLLRPEFPATIHKDAFYL